MNFELNFVEHSNIFYNKIEITNIYCEKCKTCPPLVRTGLGGAELDTCGCVRINGRVILSTKGNILVKNFAMYDEDYDEDEEESDYDDDHYEEFSRSDRFYDDDEEEESDDDDE